MSMVATLVGLIVVAYVILLSVIRWQSNRIANLTDLHSMACDEWCKLRDELEAAKQEIKDDALRADRRRGTIRCLRETIEELRK